MWPARAEDELKHQKTHDKRQTIQINRARKKEKKKMGQRINGNGSKHGEQGGAFLELAH